MNCVDDTSSEKKATPSGFSQKIDIMHDHKTLSDNKYKSEGIFVYDRLVCIVTLKIV